MNPDTLFRAFKKLPNPQQWQFWAKMRLWEREQEDRLNLLYDIARDVCHEQGMPWTDPRTGITHQPPAKKVKR